MTLSRIASLVVAAAYLVAAFVLRGSNPQILVACIGITLLPLPFIWFPGLGQFTGPALTRSINQPTPAIAIAVAGWVILAIVPPLVLVMTG
jgi:hypothetical protein